MTVTYACTPAVPVKVVCSTYRNLTLSKSPSPVGLLIVVIDALLAGVLPKLVRVLRFLRDTTRRRFFPLVDPLLYPYLRLGIVRRQIENRPPRPAFFLESFQKIFGKKKLIGLYILFIYFPRTQY